MELYTLQWDMHEVKSEWRGSVDFIYFNFLDHSYAHGLCLDAWMQCLKPGGRYGVREVLPLPSDAGEYRFLVLQNFPQAIAPQSNPSGA